jgi:hypothetical protein
MRDFDKMAFATPTRFKESKLVNDCQLPLAKLKSFLEKVV